MERIAQTLKSMALMLVRVVLALAGMVFVIGAFVFAVTVAMAVLAWALLRRRRPAAGVFRMPKTPRWQGFKPGRAPLGDVVDVEAREVNPRELGRPEVLRH